MNLYKNDNYKYLKNDWQDQEGTGKKAKQRRLIALFRDRFAKFYIDFSKLDTYNNTIGHYKNNILPDLYKKYKKKDLRTRSIIKELLNTKDKDNIIIAHEILKSTENEKVY